MTRPEEAAAHVFRTERTRLLAALIRRFGDFELAEDSLQDAFAAATSTWRDDGVPAEPAAWIYTAALHRGLDVVRRAQTFRRIAPEVARPAAWTRGEDEIVPCDDRLRLVFTCCHPALDPASRVALTLQTVGGLSAREVGRAFLVPEVAMAQRLVRVKRKIRDAGIPYRVPPEEELAARLDDVRAVVYLVFNEGHAATEGAALARPDLCEEAIRLARLLAELVPRDAETAGLLALLLCHHARSPARAAADGEMVPLDEQDRSLWDAALAREGAAVLDAALALGAPGPYQIQAAISSLHSSARRAEDTDWAEIAALYASLRRFDAGPVVALNEIVAESRVAGAGRALPRLDALGAAADLAAYQPFHAAKADLLRRAGRTAEARAAYERAIELTLNDGERRFLARRRDATRDG